MRLLALGAFLLMAAACEPTNGTDGDADTDVDADTDADADPCPPEHDCCSDAECSDRIFCNGIERCDRGQCEPGPPIDCEDGLACTDDHCDEMANVCVHVPNHTRCDDGDRCNGVERCDPANVLHDEDGCIPGRPLVCDDGDDCTEDYCMDNECRVRLRDADGDGHGDRNCTLCDDAGNCERGDDCDDNDASIHPGAVEICDDGKDNNCDRIRDYADPACTVPNDTCATALELRDRTTIFSSNRRTRDDIDEGCAAPSSPDVAFYFGLARDSDVRLVLDAMGGRDLYVALSTDCGAAVGTFRCERGRTFEVEARSLPPGTYFVIASAAADLDFSIRLELDPAGTTPEGDLCANAVPLSGDGVPVSGTLSGAGHDYTLSCAGDPGLDLVYEISLGTEQTADFEVELTTGSGPVTLSLQDVCGLTTRERACWTGEARASGRVWRLRPGTYFLVVSHADEVAFDVRATFSPLDPDLFFVEDFGGGAAGWTLRGAWQTGVPYAAAEPAPYSGACLATTIGGNHPSSMSFSTDYAETPTIDLRGARAPYLRFQSWLRSSPWGYDGGHVEVSVDGGPFTLATDVTPRYDGALGSSQGWWGERATWTLFEANLAAHVGRVVAIRFAYYSSWSDTLGWYVDDVMVLER